jgi:hypothetical protein
MKRSLLCLLLALVLPSPVLADRLGLEIMGYHHPPKEPKGLYLVTFRIVDTYTDRFWQLQYRVYCPTAMVRNISNSTWGSSRSALEEDHKSFFGGKIMRRVVYEICP